MPKAPTADPRSDVLATLAIELETMFKAIYTQYRGPENIAETGFVDEFKLALEKCLADQGRKVSSF